MPPFAERAEERAAIKRLFQEAIREQGLSDLLHSAS